MWSGRCDRLAVGRNFSLRALAARQRTDHHIYIAVAHQFWRGVNVTVASDGLSEPVHDGKAELLVCFLPPFEAQLHAHFHVGIEKLDGVVGLGGEIVLSNGGGELDFFHHASRTAVFGVLTSLSLFVKQFAILGYAANRWGREGNRFDQIQPPALRQSQRIAQRHDTELIFGLVNNADLARANFSVATMFGFARLKRTERTTQWTLRGAMVRRERADSDDDRLISVSFHVELNFFNGWMETDFENMD